ncbi:hypothetical protein SAMN04487866_101548 [Thermoactinomyces sp. DSM 45891]|uniref:hypothetical protein n=1 Tax=Thermoactinomyces sp. DSM 45891 TaxID=1761907 RepID=UPI000918F5D6|nr:hypothetical protein [Thermoactinomyces sp. DSM 45891]SFX10622.1 hypothetical protein SAMN04487866_101548 [Thermoactinomyces sp. DSM 45891]
MKKRFKNRNKSLQQFGYEFLVVCPSCRQCAKIITLEDTDPRSLGAKRRLFCTHCGHNKELVPKGNHYRYDIGISTPRHWRGDNREFKKTCSMHPRRWLKGTGRIGETFDIQIGGPFDWYFGIPVYLQANCCGHKLWAYNLEHLEYIERYVEAELRDSNSANRSIESRLPKWIKSARNRERILTCIEQMRRSLVAGSK